MWQKARILKAETPKWLDDVADYAQLQSITFPDGITISIKTLMELRPKGITSEAWRQWLAGSGRGVNGMERMFDFGLMGIRDLTLHDSGNTMLAVYIDGQKQIFGRCKQHGFYHAYEPYRHQ